MEIISIFEDRARKSSVTAVVKRERFQIFQPHLAHQITTKARLKIRYVLKPLKDVIASGFRACAAKLLWHQGNCRPISGSKAVLAAAIQLAPKMTALINQPHPSIDKASIKQLVDTFYGRAREDAVIGPIFTQAVADWDHHLDQIAEFWSSVILKTGSYEGRPMPPHLRLGLKGDHFDRWLELFEQTAREVFPPEGAIVFIDRARRIADSFEMAIATHGGTISTPRHSRKPL